MSFPFFHIGAGDEARTRDLNLGKVALYQLSYSRRACNCTRILKCLPSPNFSNSLASHNSVFHRSRWRDLHLGHDCRHHWLLVFQSFGHFF